MIVKKLGIAWFVLVVVAGVPTVKGDAALSKRIAALEAAIKERIEAHGEDLAVQEMIYRYNELVELRRQEEAKYVAEKRPRAEVEAQRSKVEAAIYLRDGAESGGTHDPFPALSTGELIRRYNRLSAELRESRAEEDTASPPKDRKELEAEIARVKDAIFARNGASSGSEGDPFPDDSTAALIRRYNRLYGQLEAFTD